MKKERLHYVDLLRILAMIPVVACHWNRALEYSGVGCKMHILPDEICSVYLGSFGVAIFFVLSGISLMYTYEGKLDLKKYFMKRFKGIYPMFYLAFIIAFIYFFIKNRGGYYTTAPKWTIIWTILGMDGYFNWFGPNWYLLGEWFLGCLIFLYLLFPVLKWGVEKHPIITGIVIMAIYVVWPIFYNGTIPVDNFFVFRLPEFVFGMYFVHYWKKPNLFFGIGALVLLVLMQVLPYPFEKHLYANTLVGVLVVIFVAWICQYIKGEKFFGFCAKISKYCYPVFLVHHVIITEFSAIFTGKTLGIAQNYIAFMIACIFIAIASVLLYTINKKIMSLFTKKAKINKKSVTE